MKSIHNTLYCAAAAYYTKKESKKFKIRRENHGIGRPTGCSWHADAKNLELWKSANGRCDDNGYAGCFCKKFSSMC